jgi:hypothetical protein
MSIKITFWHPEKRLVYIYSYLFSFVLYWPEGALAEVRTYESHILRALRS